MIKEWNKYKKIKLKYLHVILFDEYIFMKTKKNMKGSRILRSRINFYFFDKGKFSH